MLLNLLINTGSSRPSTILLTIYLYLLQVIAYPTLATKEKQTDARRGQQVQSRTSQPAETEAKRANSTSNTKDV